MTNSKNSQKHKDVAKDKPPAGSCYRCGGKHSQLTCQLKSEICHFCNKRGNIAKVCKTRMAQSTPTKPPMDTHQVTQDSPCDTSSSEYTLFTLPSQQLKPLKADVEVEGHHLNMEIDTGAAVSIVSDKIRSITLVVVKEDGPALIGRNWLTKIRLDWRNIFAIREEQQLDNLLHRYSRQAWDCKGLKG